MDDEASAESMAIEDAVEAIKPHLAGRPVEIQGAIIADLMALWLAGHSPDIREDILDFQIDQIRQLTLVEEALMFGEAGHPDRRQESEE